MQDFNGNGRIRHETSDDSLVEEFRSLMEEYQIVPAYEADNIFRMMLGFFMHGKLRGLLGGILVGLVKGL